MFTAQRLTETNFTKFHFDPSSKEDRAIAYKFFKTGTWKGITPTNTCPFFCEWPYVEIPEMLKDKLVKYYMSQE